MSRKGRRNRRRLPMASLAGRQSKAAITVDIRSQHKEVCDNIRSLRDTAAELLACDKPTKRARKELLDTADTLLLLQDDVQQKVPKLLPSDCTKYSLNRLQSESNRLEKTNENESAPRDNMRIRYFSICGHSIPLPENRFNMRIRTFYCAGILIRLPQNLVQYTTTEVCSILSEYEELKNTSKELPYSERKWIPSLRRIIVDMLCYKEGPLIPCSLSSMFRIFNKFKNDPSIQWPVIGRPPILSSEALMSSVRSFEKDEGRAVGKKDMNQFLKEAKVDNAKQRGMSTLSVVSPTNRSNDNYMAFLLQLDADRAKGQKSKLKEK